MNLLNICIAGLGNVGSSVINTINQNHELIKDKASLSINILGISSKNRLKKRSFNIDSYNWYENPLDLVEIKNCNVLIELIGEEKGISFELIKRALNNKIHVVTANKSLLAKHGCELFKIAENNKVVLLYEAAVAGGIPIIKTIKNSIFLNNILKISGILNGTTNYILSKMESENLSFDKALVDAQSKGYAELDSTSDIGGYDSAYKLTILSTICFGSEINFSNNEITGIANIQIDDILNAKKFGYKIKLISEASIVDGKISCITEPKLIKINNPLANVNGVLNAIKIETDQLETLFLEGEGAGGKATASSVISDLYEIFLNSNIPSLGYKVSNLKNLEKLESLESESFYYIRIMTKDIAGVLSRITSHFKESNISIEKIFQNPESIGEKLSIPIIIFTHKVKRNLLIHTMEKIENLDFVLDKIIIMNINKN
jgi:homoserine dehydrogenase